MRRAVRVGRRGGALGSARLRAISPRRTQLRKDWKKTAMGCRTAGTICYRNHRHETPSDATAGPGTRTEMERETDKTGGIARGIGTADDIATAHVHAHALETDTATATDTTIEASVLATLNPAGAHPHLASTAIEAAAAASLVRPVLLPTTAIITTDTRLGIAANIVIASGVETGATESAVGSGAQIALAGAAGGMEVRDAMIWIERGRRRGVENGAVGTVRRGTDGDADGRGVRMEGVVEMRFGGETRESLWWL